MKKLVLLTFIVFSFFTNAEAACSVTINASGPTTILQGDSVTLTALPFGVSPFSYSWSPGGATTQSIEAIPPTTTTFTVSTTDSLGCVSNSSIKIWVTIPIVVTVSANTSICMGSCVQLSASGGGNYSWAPSNGLNSITSCCPTACPTTTTTYTVSNGTSSATTTVTVNPLPTITVNSPTVCKGQCGEFTVSGGITYSWAPSGGLIATTGFPVFCGSITTTYTVTAVNASGCTSTSVTTAVVNPLLSTITINPPNASYCSGSYIQLTASGANTYSWNPPMCLDKAVGATVSHICTNTTCTPVTYTYTVTGTDANGCVNSGVKQVTVKGLSKFALSSATICSGDSATLTATPLCGDLNSYSWAPSGLICVSSPSACSVTLSPTTTTTYTVYNPVSIGVGLCSALPLTTTVTVLPPPLLSVISNSNNTLHFTPTAGYTYQWYNNNTLIPGASDTLYITTQIGCYRFKATNTINGCSSFSSPFCIGYACSAIVNPSGPTTFCQGGNVTLTTVAAGTPPYSYLWSNGLTTSSISVITSGTYTVEVIDSVGCATLSQGVVVKVPLITASPTQTICQGDAVTICASGSTTCNCSWSPGANLSSTTGCCVTAFPPVTSTYTVICTDTSGCKDTATTTVIVNVPIISLSQNTTVCAGSCLALTVSGGASYVWSTGATGSSITVCPTSCTTYSVIASGANGCSISAFVTVCVNPLPLVNASPDQTICFGQTALLTSSCIGTCSWGPPISLSSITGCSVTATPASTGTTTYTVTCTDINGCKNTDTTKVTALLPPIVSISKDTVVCLGSCGVVLTVSGGINYIWIPGGATGTSVSVCPSSTSCTTYTVIASGSNGCTATKTTKVCVNPLPPKPVITCGGDTIFSGTDTSYASYQWLLNNNPIPGATIDHYVTLTAGTYSIQITTTQGCTNTFSAPSCFGNVCSATINASGVTTFCQGGSVTLTALATGTAPYKYSWSSGATTSSINVTTSGTYTVVITDSVGCAALSQGVVVKVNPLPVIIARDTCVCIGSCVVLTVSGGSSYQWSTGATGSIIAVCPTVTTCYTVVAIDLNGCTAIKSVCVCINPLPVVNARPNQTICQGQSVILTSGSIPCNCSWSPGGVIGCSITVTPLTTATYTVTCTNANGCSNSATTTVTVNPLPIIKINPKDSAICVGECITFTASGGVIYTWSTGTSVCPPVGVNSYSVTGMDANGCVNSDTSTIHVFPNPCQTGINEPNDLTGIHLFPNPFSNSSILIVPDELRNGNTSVCVYDVLGNRLSTIPIEKEQTIINRKDLASGIYFYLIVRDEKRIYGGKMVVE